MRIGIMLPALAGLVLAGPAGAQSLDLGAGGFGLSIGNSARWAGLRINWRDRGVEAVHGLNVTLWRPAANPDFDMNGVALGLFGPDAARIRGLALGLGGVTSGASLDGVAVAGLGVVSDGRITGLAVAGLGVVSRGDLVGVSFAGLGIVSNRDMTGVNVAGLGTVSQGSMTGINLAGLGLVAERDLTGINAAGLGTVAQGNMVGLNVAGLGLVASGDMFGLNVGGLGTVAQGDMGWLNVAGLGLVADGRLRGLSVSGLAAVASGGIEGVAIAGLAIVGSRGVRGIAAAGLGVVAENDAVEGLALTLGKLDAGEGRGILVGGYRVKADELQGLIASAIMMRTSGFTGIAIAPYTEVRDVQRGLSIGLFNRAETLYGVQLGLLNYAGNNPDGLRWLPVLNLHFD